MGKHKPIQDGAVKNKHHDTHDDNDTENGIHSIADNAYMVSGSYRMSEYIV